ncbi:hypothetical protein GKZ68_13325 [Hymenobacter sp. BRD128]|uniref:hypothetical protein n=1 Tax=Hymenobacter sp. BRD128 TaxID=2675878 RepID=UPI001564C35F|nr:hypothetical protein [Hymenobacter sp. BRD128]QKG57517.1 hypothetical protein GKZ68_13325 [Hymenobacter sp. BRD128]
MNSTTYFLLPGLLWNQLASAQRVEFKGTQVVNNKLITLFIKQTYLLRKEAINQHFYKKISPAPNWLIPTPGDKLVTYYQLGDTLFFYRSGQTVTLLGCNLTNAARFAQAVPFLASTKDVLFAGKYKTRNVLTITEAARNEQYTLTLTFQDKHIRRLFFYLDTSTF